MNFMIIAIVILRQHLLGAARWGEDLFYRYTRVLTPVFPLPLPLPLPLPFPRYSHQSNTNTTNHFFNRTKIHSWLST
jgi:hypothetical protein